MPDFFDDSILPPQPASATPVLHDREYRVRAFRLSAERLLIQGGLRDQKPPGLYIPNDTDPLTVHHMQISIEVAFPSLEIVDVITHFEAHPHDACPSITAHYDHLIGLSIARGFTHRVRELFGGPRGCTHTTALLQAMAPVAVQCMWSMQAATDAEHAGDGDRPRVLERPADDDHRWQRIINTCHVWDEEGPVVAARRAGAPDTVPVFLRARLASLGINADDVMRSDG